ncbi:hypothetical protein ASE01_09885 [Nocardioides sp. Root190]|uniref:PDGLE domain-containing protein n=1 Tax=Nocardioides sp. Root190 TaxID=1736488 RepID=UPI0006F793E3|nr:PDGLE domain-containing protein [Nocardioides sp. Root190]KRB77060.1 hypothetical protein ASE01_09885 [Nocardioides sp. Root190]
MSATGTTTSRRFLVIGLLVALLVAGVGSFYASSHPDGLEYVAGRTGFLDTAEEDPVSTGSPFADYGTEGVDNERLSGGIAGVVGVLLTLLIGGGLFHVLGRRGGSEEYVDSPEPPVAARD